MSTLKKFLTYSKNIERSGAVWNMIASMLTAFQSVILLIVITHTVGLIPAGIYTIGNTNSNLFLSIGKYGVRQFQVSDIKREFKFREYRIARVVSLLLMTVISCVYVLFVANRNGYTVKKFWIVIWMCLFKLPDAFEDVYYGDYQKNNRLDVGSKALALRMIVTIILWMTILIVTRDLLESVVISTIVTTLLMIWFIFLTREYITETDIPSFSRVGKLLLVTFPLALASFLTLYVSAAPKNSIDAHLDDSLQAIYGFLSMPVFVVQLLVQFVFNPLLYKISCIWDDKNIDEYLKETIKLIGVVIIITIFCLVGAWLLGVPVLSFIYNTDLKLYKLELMILMVGSGVLGFISLMSSLLTVMRHQVLILIGYIIVSVIAFFFTDIAIIKYGIKGAAIFYLLLLIILVLIFTLGFIFYVIKERINDDGI